ncbi:MAG: hypothetical protein HC769_33085 [Cyanobacteria bacterium CRU_2_1]|nr:hypothetical protein [Cyanobacteria bacterium CRU_2_1]
MPRKFNYVRAAAALVEASLKSDREVALAFGVAVRTLEYWRHRLKSDEVLQQEFRKMAQEKLAQWVSEIPDSLGMAIGFITSAARSGDVTDPKMVEAMVGAISVLSEVLVLASAIEQRRSGDE